MAKRGREVQQEEDDEDLAGYGHNSGDDEPVNVEGKKLLSYIERIERLEEDKSAIQGDINDVFSEAKSYGYDVKTLRKVLKIRKMKPAQREEEQHMLDTYLHALNMI